MTKETKWSLEPAVENLTWKINARFLQVSGKIIGNHQIKLPLKYVIVVQVYATLPNRWIQTYFSLFFSYLVNLMINGSGDNDDGYSQTCRNYNNKKKCINLTGLGKACLIKIS